LRAELFSIRGEVCLGRQQKIITDNTNLDDQYHLLESGDIVVGRIRMKTGEEHLLHDLHARGVHLVPSALSQLLSRSKTFQSRILSSFMLPHTLAVYDLHGVLAAVNLYGRNGIEKVVTKHDRRNAGMGVHLWASIEEVYSQASIGTMEFPFVIQPFHPECRDIRIVTLGDYQEAYWRHNPDNFRHNLHCGGESAPCELSDSMTELCNRVLARGRFIYAHIDLIVTKSGDIYLSEINLGGGIRGARISREAYREKIAAIHRDQLKKLREQTTSC